MTSHRVALMHEGKVWLVPPDETLEGFAQARGWPLPSSGAAAGPSPLLMGDQGRRKAPLRSQADGERFIASNLREGVRAGRLILARTAAARLGAVAYAHAVRDGKLIVHTVGRRRYVDAADVSALQRAQTSGAAATIATHIAQSMSSRPKRKRRPPPEWMR